MKKGKKGKKKSRLRRFLMAALVLAVLLGVGAYAVTNVFTVEKTVVTGNEHYPDRTITDWILDDEYSWNSLYVYFRYKFVDPKEMPFVDSMEVSLRSPHVLEIHVSEKIMLGRIYVDALGQSAYFDKDGFVVEMSSEEVGGVPLVEGLETDKIVLYEKLPIKDKGVLKDLLSLTQMLKKYNMKPENIRYEGDGGFSLKYGDIYVRMGEPQNLNEKVTRLARIIPMLEGEKGTLHLESWAEYSTDVTFEKTG